MTASTPAMPLAAIRREIDAIDGQILSLLGQRFAATEKVRLSKAHDGSIAASPFRPAREADMLRRLIAEAGPGVAPDTLVRLWRVILSASIQSQAPITLHMDAILGQDLATRLAVAQHFCGMTVELHDQPRTALATLGMARGDLALVAPSSDWAGGFPADGTAGPQVIGTLPVLAGSAQPQILVFGHAEPQPSGDDETLILLAATAPGLSGALWQARSGTMVLAAVSGFLADGSPELAAILSHAPGARVAGRYPRPIKVSP